MSLFFRRNEQRLCEWHWKRRRISEIIESSSRFIDASRTRRHLFPIFAKNGTKINTFRTLFAPNARNAPQLSNVKVLQHLNISVQIKLFLLTKLTRRKFVKRLFILLELFIGWYFISIKCYFLYKNDGFVDVFFFHPSTLCNPCNFYQLCEKERYEKIIMLTFHPFINIKNNKYLR